MQLAESGACAAGPHSPWSPPFAPPIQQLMRIRYATPGDHRPEGQCWPVGRQDSKLCISNGRGRFFDLNIRPDFRVFCIQRQPFLKAWLDISLDGIDGTLRLANATVDTFVRMDDEHILALVEAVHGAHCNAVHGFAANTAIVDDVSQFSTPNSLEGEILAKNLPEGIQLFESWAAPRAVSAFESDAHSKAVVIGTRRHSHFVPGADSCTAAKRCDGQPFSSRFSSLKKRQSAPCAMILLGGDLIIPASRSRSE
jgi:hypothetical protein